MWYLLAEKLNLALKILHENPQILERLLLLRILQPSRQRDAPQHEAYHGSGVQIVYFGIYAYGEDVTTGEHTATTFRKSERKENPPPSTLHVLRPNGYLPSTIYSQVP